MPIKLVPPKTIPLDHTIMNSNGISHKMWLQSVPQQKVNLLYN